MISPESIQQDINLLNALVEDWKNKTIPQLKGNYQSYLKGGSTGEGLAAIKGFVHKRHGEAERVAFKIKRYQVFFEKGVGKSRGINSGRTTPRPWFNKTLERALPELQNLVTENFHDRIINLNNAFIK